MAHDNNQFLFGENCSNCGQIICYVDDATMVFSSHTWIENQLKLVYGLNKIDRFLTANRLAVNRTKTAIQEIMIGQKRARQTVVPPVLLEPEPDGSLKVIRSEQQCKLLGGILQDNMSWAAHLDWGEDTLLPAARQKLGVLKHLGRSLPLRSRKLLVDRLVLSKIRYLLPIWGGAAEKHMRMVQTLLNDAAHYVTRKTTRRDSSVDLMLECGWMTAAEMANYYSLLLLWRVIRLNAQQSLATKITIDDDCFVTTAFRWRSTTLWNSMPDDLRHNMSLKSFKRNTKKWILTLRGHHLDPGEQ